MAWQCGARLARDHADQVTAFMDGRREIIDLLSSQERWSRHNVPDERWWALWWAGWNEVVAAEVDDDPPAPVQVMPAGARPNVAPTYGDAV